MNIPNVLAKIHNETGITLVVMQETYDDCEKLGRDNLSLWRIGAMVYLVESDFIDGYAASELNVPIKQKLKNAKVYGCCSYELLAEDVSLVRAATKAISCLVQSEFLSQDALSNILSPKDTTSLMTNQFLTKEIFTRDSNRCVYCGRKATAMDHIVPVSVDGQTVLNNLVASCTNCNVRKSNADWEKWYKFQKFYDPQQADYIASILAS
jgi:hypothetical protein